MQLANTSGPWYEPHACYYIHSSWLSQLGWKWQNVTNIQLA